MTNSLTSKVELIISCRDLVDCDILSKSDPMVVLFIKHGTDNFVEYGRTETIWNNLNPDFSKGFTIDYYFEEIQKLKFQVYDIDSRSTRLDQHDFLGEYECSLGEIVSRSKIEAKLVGRDEDSRKKGRIIVRSSEVGSCKELLVFSISGHNLEKRKWFGKSDPYLELHRVTLMIPYTGENVTREMESSQFLLVHRTEQIRNSLNPQWKSFQVRNSRLCGGDRDRLLRIDCFGKKDDMIGSFYTSVNDMYQHMGHEAYFKIFKRKQGYSEKNKILGQITIQSLKVETEYTFLDYISGGTQLDFSVAIDFTASNGQQNDPRSLHYIRPGYGQLQLNQYELAITSVGRIIQDYDFDKMFPAFGFGAKIPPNLQVSHCFPLTFQLENPFCHLVEGLLQAYQNCVRQVQLFGPTNFAPSIRHVQKYAEAYRDGSHYFVLLIITDGIITDIDQTIDSIVDCSYFPMSIIIVGVGNEDFAAMDMLDCDNGLLRSGMKVAERDIVQFVPLRDFLQNRDPLANQAHLARAVLAELPDQLAGWMRCHHISPLPRTGGDVSFSPSAPTQANVTGATNLSFINNTQFPPNLPPPPYSL